MQKKIKKSLIILLFQVKEVKSFTTVLILTAEKEKQEHPGIFVLPNMKNTH